MTAGHKPKDPSLAPGISVSTGTMVRAVLVLIGFYFLYFVRDVVLVMLTAIVIASAVEPGTRWFVERRIPRVVAVLSIYLGVIASIALVFYFLLIPLVRETAVFLQSLPEYSEAVRQANATAPLGTGIIEGISAGFSLPALIASMNAWLATFSTGFFGAIDVVFGGVLSFLLIFVISFYLAVQEDGVGAFLKIVAPITHERYVIDLWNRSKKKIGLWMQGQLLLAVIVAVLAYLGLLLLGVENALLLAFLAGAFELIPLFGSFLAAIPAVLVAFADGGATTALLVAGLFVIINQFEGQLIYPLVVKKVVGVPPIISIVALVVGGKLAGFVGVLIAVPVAAVLMELLNDYERGKRGERLIDA
jgi:predicted PurR-regulated permease PerM